MAMRGRGLPAGVVGLLTAAGITYRFFGGEEPTPLLEGSTPSTPGSATLASTNNDFCWAYNGTVIDNGQCPVPPVKPYDWTSASLGFVTLFILTGLLMILLFGIYTATKCLLPRLDDLAKRFVPQKVRTIVASTYNIYAGIAPWSSLLVEFTQTAPATSFYLHGFIIIVSLCIALRRTFCFRQAPELHYFDAVEYQDDTVRHMVNAIRVLKMQLEASVCTASELQSKISDHLATQRGTISELHTETGRLKQELADLTTEYQRKIDESEKLKDEANDLKQGLQGLQENLDKLVIAQQDHAEKDARPSPDTSPNPASSTTPQSTQPGHQFGSDVHAVDNGTKQAVLASRINSFIAPDTGNSQVNFDPSFLPCGSTVRKLSNVPRSKAGRQPKSRSLLTHSTTQQDRVNTDDADKRGFSSNNQPAVYSSDLPEHLKSGGEILFSKVPQTSFSFSGGDALFEGFNGKPKIDTVNMRVETPATDSPGLSMPHPPPPAHEAPQQAHTSTSSVPSPSTSHTKPVTSKLDSGKSGENLEMKVQAAVPQADSFVHDSKNQSLLSHRAPQQAHTPTSSVLSDSTSHTTPVTSKPDSDESDEDLEKKVQGAVSQADSSAHDSSSIASPVSPLSDSIAVSEHELTNVPSRAVPYKPDDAETGEKFLCKRGSLCLGDHSEYRENGEFNNHREGKFGTTEMHGVKDLKKKQRGSRLFCECFHEAGRLRLANKDRVYPEWYYRHA